MKFDSPLHKKLHEIRGELAEAAQKEYADWDPDFDEYGDPEVGGGGICQDVACAMGHVLDRHGIDNITLDNNGVGDQHVWVGAHDGKNFYHVDINPYHYESGSGYSWQKNKGVKLNEDHVDIIKGNIEDHIDPETGDPHEYQRRESPEKYALFAGLKRFLSDESPIAHPIKIAENLKLIPSDADYAGQHQDAEDKALFKTPPKAAGVFAKGEGAPRERVAMRHALRNLGVPVVGTHGDKLVDAAGAAIRSHYLANPEDPHLAAYSQIAKGFEGTPSFHDITQAGSHLAQVLKNADIHDPFVKHFHKQAAHAMGLGHDEPEPAGAEPALPSEPELDIPSHEELGTKPKTGADLEPQDIADDQHWLQNKGLTSAKNTSDRVKQLKAGGASADEIKAALMAEFGMGKRSANSAMKAAERAEKPKGKKAKKSRLLEALVKYKKAA